MRKNLGKNNRKGFTLIELIVVLVILGIIAGIAVPNIIAYKIKADQRARTDMAQTIFYAAQNALTDKISAEGKASFRTDYGKGDGAADLSKVTPSMDTNSNNIVYIETKKSDAKSTKEASTIYKLMDSYLTDSDILDGTVLIEYNKTSGKVLSVFYSEVDSGIAYSGQSASVISSDNGTYNADLRSNKNLKDGTMGYYTVGKTVSENTGLPDIDEPQLVDHTSYTGTTGSGAAGYNINGGQNYGLLTAEFKLPDNWAAYIYKLKLTTQGGSVTLQIGGDTKDADADYKLDSIASLSGKTLTDAIGISDNYGAYVDSSANGDILTVVLDSANTQYSILNNNYSGLCASGDKQISASMTVSIGSQSVSSSTPVDDKVYTYFGGQTTSGSRTTYNIASVRHLKNVQSTSADKTAAYSQTQDIYCRNYDNTVLLFNPIGHTAAQTVNEPNSFSGTYDGQYYSIYDLTENSADAGLFAKNTGTIKGVKLDYQDAYMQTYGTSENSKGSTDCFINGTSLCTGGICSQNYGTVENCSLMSGRVQTTADVAGSVSEDGFVGSITGIVGGITGVNMSTSDTDRGVVKNCYNGAYVFGRTDSRNFAGGICGVNYADVMYCENGTCRSGSASLSGTPAFGANKNGRYDYGSGTENNAVTVSAIGAGGITGRTATNEMIIRNGTKIITNVFGSDAAEAFRYKGGVVKYCVNAAKIVSEDPEGQSEAYAGGITGQLDGCNDTAADSATVIYCYNAGNISMTGRSGKTSMASGIVGATTRANSFKANGSDVTNSTVQVRFSYNTGKVESIGTGGPSEKMRAGGITAWFGFGTISNCYSVGDVVWTGNGNANKTFGGAFGGGNEAAFAVIKNCCALTGSENPNGGNDLSNSAQVSYLSKSAMKTKAFSDGGEELESGGTVGAFDYPYPHINVNNSICSMGSDFHRTPWE